MRPTLLSLTTVLVAASALTAQGRVWVVDNQNRPGADFTDLPAAVAASQDGDAIRVRAATGYYLGTLVTKGITILGEPGANMLPVFSPPLEIVGVPAGRTVVVKGLNWSTQAASGAVVVRDCAARVHLDRLTYSGNRVGVQVSGSRAVSLNACVLSGNPAVSATSATISASGCEFRGSGGVSVLFPAAPGIRLTRASLTFARGTILGGDVPQNSHQVPVGPGIDAEDSELLLAGDAASLVRAGFSATLPLPTPGIQGKGGSLTIDPQVTVQGTAGAPPIAGTIAVTSTWLPALVARGVAPGGVVQAELVAPANDLAIFLTSVAIPPLAVGAGNAFWLDPYLFFVTGVGQVGANGRLAHGNPVANDPNLSFGAWSLQAISVNFTGEFKLSNPVTYSLD